MFLLLLSWPILGLLSVLYMITEEQELTIGDLLIGIIFGVLFGWLAFGLVIITDERIERLLKIKLWSKK